MSDSTQHKLSKIRPPRVQITYDVEIGDDVQMKELPLVVGIMSDLGAESLKSTQKMKDRKFVEIDGDNFDSVMESIEPRVTLTVDNKLVNDGSKINVELKFNKMEDFRPLSVVKQVPALNKLFEARRHLTDLLGKLDGNDKLDAMLTEIIEKTPELEKIKAAVAQEEAVEATEADGKDQKDDTKSEKDKDEPKE